MSYREQLKKRISDLEAKMAESNLDKLQLDSLRAELAKLNMDWNLRLNKKKSEILTSESLQEIGGVRCTKVVKYLGVKVTADKKEQTKVAREQIDKNVKVMGGDLAEQTRT